MPKYTVAPGRAITFDSDTDKERTFREGETVELDEGKAGPFLEEGTLYPEGEDAPKRQLGEKELDPESGLLANGEATADTPAVLLAPPVQVGALHDTYVPGEEVPDESNPPENASTDPTVDDLTPEQIEALTPPGAGEAAATTAEDAERTTVVEERREAVVVETTEPAKDAPVERVQEDPPAEPKER